METDIYIWKKTNSKEHTLIDSRAECGKNSHQDETDK